MKLLHFSDLHLDVPFAWANPEAGRRRRRNRRETLTRILALAEEEAVDAVLSGGDLFEHDRVGPDTLEFLRASFERSTRRIVLAPGNHDWYGPGSPYATLGWSANVHVFSESQLAPLALADGLTLWGAAHRAPANTDGFFATFRPDRGGIHLALAHASERGALGWQDAGKQPHAPFEAAELEAAGLHHAFLGHFHLPRDHARYTYPGNPDPLEFGERAGRDGELRGVVLAEIGADGAVQRERRSVAVSEVHDLEVMVDGAEHSDDLRASLDAQLAALSGSVRVSLVGELGHGVMLDLRELSHQPEHLDGLVLRTTGIRYAHDLDRIREEQTVRGQFVRDVEAEVADPGLQRRVLTTGLRALDGRSDLEVA